MSKSLRHTLTTEEAWNYPSPDFLGRFPIGYLSIVASKPGCGKTWYMLYNIATYSREHNVGALIGDCAPTLIYDRVRRITNTFTHSNVYCYFLSEMQQRGYNIDFADRPSSLVETKRVIEQNKLHLLFIDTLASFMTCDESSQKDMTPIIQGLVKIACETQCAIVINHHLRKGNEKGEVGLDEVIGSSILTRLAAVVLTMKRRENVVTIQCPKNWFTNSEEMKFSVISINGAVTMTETTFTTTARSRSDLVQYVMNIQPDTTIPASQLAQMGNLSMHRLRELINELKTRDIVIDMTPDDKASEKLLVRKNTDKNV